MCLVFFLNHVLLTLFLFLLVLITPVPVDSQCASNFELTSSTIISGCSGVNINFGNPTTCVCPPPCTCISCGQCTIGGLPGYDYTHSTATCSCPATPSPPSIAPTPNSNIPTTNTPTHTPTPISNSNQSSNSQPNPNGQCTVVRSSVSPSQCVSPSNCAYQCSSSYVIGIVSPSVQLTPSSIPSGCYCVSGSATINGYTLSGSFQDGSTFTAGPTGINNQIQVISTVQGVQCIGTYSVTQGSCLGVTANQAHHIITTNTAVWCIFSTLLAALHSVF